MSAGLAPAGTAASFAALARMRRAFFPIPDAPSLERARRHPGFPHVAADRRSAPIRRLMRATGPLSSYFATAASRPALAARTRRAACARSESFFC